MFRPRDTRPPFEVMKAGISRSAPPAAMSSEEASAGEPAGLPAGGRESWSRWRQPMVLRVPPGYAILIILGLMVLLVIAYSAGLSQGKASNEARWQAKLQQQEGIAGRLVGPGTANADAPPPGSANARSAVAAAGGNQSGKAGAAVSTAGQAGVYDDPSLDPRKPGYQYYIVAHCSREEAQRLVDFFRERRVEAAAVISHNRQSQYVVFVLTPFTREQIGSPEARELKLRIFEMGKVWASRTYRGPTNLSDTYMALYKP